MQRNLPYLTTTSSSARPASTISQIRFELHDPALWPFMVFTATYVLYQVISLPVNFTGRGFDLAAHQARIAAWHPARYPDVDIYLPICGEPIEVLHNTWTAVAELLAAYPGAGPGVRPGRRAHPTRPRLWRRVTRASATSAGPTSGCTRRAATCATPSPGPAASSSSSSMPTSRRGPTSWPRPCPTWTTRRSASCSTPQYFRQSPEQTWIENAAGAIQEVFYRSIQVARDRFGAAICTGTSSVYRRAALEPVKGATLIPYAEDVHTGLDVRLAGWSIRSRAAAAVHRDLPGQPGLVRAAAVPVVHRERWHRLLPPAVGNPDVRRGPAHLPVRLLLLRLHRPAQLRRAAHPGHHARVPARPDPAAELRHPAPGGLRGLRPVRAVAPVQLRAVGLAAGHRPGLGPCVRALGRRPGEDDELAPVPDAGQFAAPVPARPSPGGAAAWPLLWVAAGHLALGDPWLGRSSPSCWASACSTSPWSAGSSSPEGRQHEGPGADPPGDAGRLRDRGDHHRRHRPDAPPALPDAAVVRQKLPAKSSSYLGVYEPGSPPAFRPVAEFSAMAGHQPNLVGYYSGWAEPFNISFADLMHKHGATPFVQIDPLFASMSGIAAGAYDDYLRSYADSVRSFGHPVVIGFGHEMNGSWYPWGYRHVQPATFVAAWRHIVALFASQGARERHLAVDDQRRPPRHRADQGLVARPAVRHLGRHRRLLPAAVRHVRQRLRQHHQAGTGVH